MPFNPQQVNPLDLNPNVAVGVNLPFNGPSVFTPNYLTSQAVKNNLINYFLTNPGEYPLNPTFGGGLRAFLFDQITEGTLIGLESKITSNISSVFPNVIISSLEILQDPDNNTLTVQLKYSIANSNVNDTLTLQL
jgi:phage baseplate assembly protein W